MPAPRRLSSIPPPRTKTQPLRGRRKSALIEAKRKRLFAEMALLRKVRGSSVRSVETAQDLLTKWWGRASWRTREQLLKAADWLVRLERNRGVQPSA